MQIKIVLIPILLAASTPGLADPVDPAAAGALFQHSSQCVVCHSDLSAPDGSDVSIGTSWRATMMANAARDPYWHAAVRREVLDHPAAQAAIEDKCSTCHMPMAHVTAAAAGGQSEVFANIASMQAKPVGHFAADGVSCTVCHQIGADNFGSTGSFNRYDGAGRAARDLRSARGGRRQAASDAVREQLHTRGIGSSEIVGALRDLSHALHARARR
jgi:mono/diheme cytochrome c family protein